MQSLQLITRIDSDGKWFILRHKIDDKVNNQTFYSNQIEATTKYWEAVNNFSLIGKETVLLEKKFNDNVRKMYVSVNSGAAFLKFPENSTDSFFDFQTDATIEVVENEVEGLGKVDNELLTALIELGFEAYR